MDNKEKAVAYHKQGFNCAQAVLCACGGYTGMDEKTALAIAGPFGGGCRCGEICGAVSGGLMAIGLCKPFNEAANIEAKEKIAAIAKAYTGDFAEKFTSVRCADIRGEGKSCNDYIAYAAETAEKIINNKE